MIEVERAAIVILGLFVAHVGEPVPMPSAAVGDPTVTATAIDLAEDHRRAVEWAAARAAANELLQLRRDWPECVPMRVAFAPRLWVPGCRSDLQLEILSLDGDVIASTQVGREYGIVQPSSRWKDRTFELPQGSHANERIRLRWRVIARGRRGESRLVSEAEEFLHPAVTHSRPVLMEEVPVGEVWNGLGVYLVRVNQHVAGGVRLGGFAPDDIAVGAVMHLFVDGALAMTFPFYLQEIHRMRQFGDADLPPPVVTFGVPADVADRIRHDSKVYAAVVASSTIALRDFGRDRSAAGGALVRVEVGESVAGAD